MSSVKLASSYALQSLYRLRSHLCIGIVLSAIPFACSVASADRVIPSQATHQGHGTSVLKASAMVMFQHRVRDAEQSRGLHSSLDNTESDFVCSMQKALPRNASPALIEWFAHTVAEIMHRDISQITPALKDPAFCLPQRNALRVRKTVAIVHLNAKGVVMSRNPVWNACVTGRSVSLALIRSNKEYFIHRQGSHRKLLAKTCRDYHRGNTSLWQHPDFPDLEVHLDAKGRLLGGVPTGYILKKDVR